MASGLGALLSILGGAGGAYYDIQTAKEREAIAERERQRKDALEALNTMVNLQSRGYRQLGDVQDLATALQDVSRQQATLGLPTTVTRGTEVAPIGQPKVPAIPSIAEEQAPATTPSGISLAAPTLGKQPSVLAPTIPTFTTQEPSSVIPDILKRTPGYEDVTTEDTDVQSRLNKLRQNISSAITLPGFLGGGQYALDVEATPEAAQFRRAELSARATVERAKTEQEALAKRQEDRENVILDAQRNRNKSSYASLKAAFPAHPLAQLPLDDTHDYRVDLEQAAKDKAEAGKAGRQVTAEQMQHMNRLQRRYDSNRQLTVAKSVASAVQSIFSAAQDALTSLNDPTRRGSSQQALVNSFARLSDPTTGVKEAEYANVLNQLGWFDKVKNLQQLIARGQPLNREQILDMTTTAYKLGAGSRQIVDRLNNRLLRDAERMGVNPIMMATDDPFETLDMDYRDVGKDSSGITDDQKAAIRQAIRRP
jgi:hypothetical protein